MDSVEQVYDDYAVDPSLARLRSLKPPLHPRGHSTGTMQVCILADNDFLMNDEDWVAAGETLRDLKPRLTYVLKFAGCPVVRPDEWQAAKALVAREIVATQPKAWVAVGPVACELLGVRKWDHTLAAVDVARTHGGTLVLQGRWNNIRRVFDLLLDEEAGFLRRG